jgi:hypothetical protein
MQRSQTAIAKRTEEDSMFGTQHTLRHVGRSIAIAALVAVAAVPSALAGTSSPDRTRAQACQADAVWITITDDQGVGWLVPVAHGSCTVETACTSQVQPSWAFTTDDLGVPWLVPAAKAGAASCVLSDSKPAPAPKITKSPYPGWLLVTDGNGGSKLVSRSDLR